MAQINIIGLLLGVHLKVTPYKELARQMEKYYGIICSAEAVRGYVKRLAARGFVRSKQAREGTIQGALFSLVGDKICPHIRCPYSGVRPENRPDALAGILPGVQPDASILDKIDRKNLSISNMEEDTNRLELMTEEKIALRWPKLAQIGFGTMQIRQLVESRQNEPEGLKNIIQGMTYADWALENNALQTKNGESIKSPLNWIFKILLKQGYYPRPAGYISPEEQAEIDRLEELKRLEQVRKERFEAEFEEWTACLVSEERKDVLRQIDLPEKPALRLHFKENVWPEILAEESKRAKAENQH